MESGISYTDLPALPELREELQIMEGARDIDGSRSWVIFDPVRHQYFQIGPTAVQLLGEWKLKSAEKIGQLMLDKGVIVTAEDFKELVEFLFKNLLTIKPKDGDYRNYANQAKQKQNKWWQVVVHQYLFFRISLFRPHAFLAKTYPYVAFLYTKKWLIFTLVIAVLGFYLTIRQWDMYVQTFLHFFNVKGLVFYGLSLIFVKILHELGHAYTAARYGCRVVTMGVAFLVMFPVLYTDTTDSWRLKSRKKRLAIDSAGVATELMLAVYATFLWVFLPDGVLKSMAFFIATTSWVLSLAVNLNPFMRFDGYYFLSDLLGIQNLQSRGFELGKWALREKLFGLGIEAPEVFETKMRRTLVSYAWLTWVYRFFLFLGIALLVYSFFFKALGITLFLIEIFWFILIPIYKELKVWFNMRENIIQSRRAYYLFVGVFFALALSVVPWSSTIKIPAIMEAGEHVKIFPQEAGKISVTHVKNNDVVEADELLIELVSPQIEFEIDQTKRTIELLNNRLGRISADIKDRENAIILRRELQREQERYYGLNKQAQLLNIRAPIAGKVTDLNHSLHEGRWLNSAEKIAIIQSGQQTRVRGYINSEDIHRLEQNATAVFIPDNIQIKKSAGRIQEIAKANAEQITLLALTSRYDGEIALSESETDAVPIGTWYGVIVNLTENQPNLAHSHRGILHARGEKESFIKKVWRQILKIIVRESSL